MNPSHEIHFPRKISDPYVWFLLSLERSIPYLITFMGAENRKAEGSSLQSFLSRADDPLTPCLADTLSHRRMPPRIFACLLKNDATLHLSTTKSS